MNVFLRELKAYRKSTIIWAASLSALLLVFMLLYPAFSADVDATREIFAQFPEALRNALNLSLENFFTLYGFYGYLLTFAILSAAIQATNVGVGVISKEVAGKTADFLLSKPVTRTRVVTAKLAAALVSVLVVFAIFLAVSIVMALAVGTGTLDFSMLLLLALTMLFVQLVFLALGALMGVLLPKVKSVVAVSLPTVFTFYIIGVIGDLLENESARYLSPFRYFDTGYIIANRGYENGYLLFAAVLVVAMAGAAYVLYDSKDVRASA